MRGDNNMKKFFSVKKTIVLALISLLVLFVVSASTVTAAEILKQSDSIPVGDYYGAYYDNSKGKVSERTIDIDSQKIILKYVRTENLKEKPASKRSDNYGTYDIYIDDNQTEYLFLLNSDIYCGFKLNMVGIATEKENAISEDKAIEIANAFLFDNRDNYRNYKMSSCEYSELAGYYDIQFYLPVCGFKSDDIIRIWVDAQGNVVSFSEFNYQRYDHIEIEIQRYARADKKIGEIISTQTQKANFYVVDSYISIDNSGNIVLIKVIDIAIPNGDTSAIQREIYVQSIS